MEKTSLPLSSQEESAQHKHELTVAKFIMAAGIGTWIAGWFSESDDLTTSWDNYVLPLLATLYIIAGVIAYLRPKWVLVGVVLALIPTGIYEQGVFYLAVHHPDRASYYTAAGSGAWFPLLYVTLFIAFPKGAAKWSWLHYAGFALQFIANHSFLADPSPSPDRIAGEHLLVEVLLAHPAYIVALSVIAQLRDRLHATKEEAFRSKESFLAMLSHEIRNLLQTMVGAIDLLDIKAKDPAQRETITHLSRATVQLQTYLNDIIEFTRLEDPSMRVNASTFDAIRMLEELQEEWLPDAKGRGLYLHLNIDEAARRELSATISDESRLRQIVSNLISNSLKYTSTGGVTISASISADPKTIRLEVVDTGIGIEEQYLKKIFQPYVRLENAKKQSAEGSGLGLAVVERLVGYLGGKLQVISQVDKGTRFIVEVPG